MSELSKLQQGLNRHLGYADDLVLLHATLNDGQELTLAQRALAETQLNLISEEVNGGVVLLPTLEDLQSKDQLVMEEMDDLIKRVLEAVVKGIIKMIRWIAVWILKLYDRTKGLKQESILLRKQMDGLRGMSPHYPDFTIRGALAQALGYGGRFSYDYSTLSQEYAKSKGLASVLLGGSYSDALSRLGPQLENILVDVRATGPEQAVSRANSVVEKSLREMGILNGQVGLQQIQLIGGFTMSISSSPITSVDTLNRSREIQQFFIDYSDETNPSTKINIRTLSLDELNMMFNTIDSGLYILDDFNKKKVANKLLKTAGGLQTKLNTVLREMDLMRGEAGFNDSMIALSRYMTAYAAWVQDPIDRYGRYFLSLNASLLDICRLSMRQYV